MKKHIFLISFILLSFCLLPSCTKDNKATDEEIRGGLGGKWKLISYNGEDCLSINRCVFTFNDDRTLYCSLTEDSTGRWYRKALHTWYFAGASKLLMTNPAAQQTTEAYVEEINKETMKFSKHILPYANDEFIWYDEVWEKVYKDFSSDVIGLWEGIGLEGEKTSEAAFRRFRFKEDGTYIFYKNEDGEWTQSDHTRDEYVVDGDWFAALWRDKSGTEHREAWDISACENGCMTWTAVRLDKHEKRYTETLTLKKVQEEKE